VVANAAVPLLALVTGNARLAESATLQEDLNASSAMLPSPPMVVKAVVMVTAAVVTRIAATAMLNPMRLHPGVPVITLLPGILLPTKNLLTVLLAVGAPLLLRLLTTLGVPPALLLLKLLTILGVLPALLLLLLLLLLPTTALGEEMKCKKYQKVFKT